MPVNKTQMLFTHYKALGVEARGHVTGSECRTKPQLRHS